MIYIICLVSCGTPLCRNAIEPIDVTLEVERLEDEFFNAASSEDMALILKENPDFAQFFLHADQYPADSILADRIFRLIKDPAIDTLYREALDAFEEFDEKIVRVLEKSFGRLKAYYPETKIPVVQTSVTGLYNDLFISNEHIMIGLDFFIGENATYKPQQIPHYLLRRYDPDHLPSHIMRFTSSQYIKPCKGKMMLAEMIDHGKSYYLLNAILPCTPERILIGYTEDEWIDVFENDEIIWANFVQNEWLYETNHTIKQKFLGERPNIYEIGDKCPGRIGQWLGWQIVNNYAEKTGISLQKLMAETDAHKIFIESGYKPLGN